MITLYEYVVSLLLLGVLGYQLNIGMSGNRLASHLYERAILEQIEKHPDNADLYSLLGKVYFNRENWPGVLKAWEKSLAIYPDNAEVLNNLAWTYATCEDQQFQDPNRALAMATLAVRLENQPHIWDTLAESYYVNQMYSKAVEAGRQAFDNELAPGQVARRTVEVSPSPPFIKVMVEHWGLQHSVQDLTVTATMGG